MKDGVLVALIIVYCFLVSLLPALVNGQQVRKEFNMDGYKCHKWEDAPGRELPTTKGKRK